MIQSTQNSGMQPDKRPMEVLKEIANTVDRNLKFTVDFPSNNPDGKLPILDHAFWVEWGSYTRHDFYRKPCVPNRTIMARSTLSNYTKRAT